MMVPHSRGMGVGAARMSTATYEAIAAASGGREMPSPYDSERLLAALKASRCGTWRWSVPEDTVEWDEALCRLYGVEPSQAPRTADEFLEFVHADDRATVLDTIRDCLARGSELEYEFRSVVGGDVRWIYDRSTLTRDADGRPLAMTGACIDVTERKRIEQERDEALARQKVLLQELGHRTKNHLQLVASLLQLQAARQGDAGAKADFEKAIQRVRVIAGLHDKLYRHDEVVRVDLGDYIRTLCGDLSRSILAPRMTLDCEAEAVDVHADQAVPVAMIVNELVTNAVKHAFPADSVGRIWVRLESRGERLCLSIGDDGCGLPRAPSGGERGLGQRMVDALAGQLKAEAEIPSGRGTVYRLAFDRVPP